MVDPLDPLFTKIGTAYNREVYFSFFWKKNKYNYQVIRLFGASGFYSADVFNEMLPKSG